MPETPVVAAVLATYNRSMVLDATLGSVAAQEQRPDLVVVADNGSPDDTIEMLRTRHPDVVLVEVGENLGAGGGLAAGMRAALERGAQLMWLIDDDTQAKPEALRVLLDIWERTQDFDVGIVAPSGGVFRTGVIHHLETVDLPLLAPRRDDLRDLHTADFVVYDGGLVPSTVVERVGLPRDDFFLVFDDLEYAMRVHEAGMTLVVPENDLFERMHLGSGGDGSATSPPWRGYYQTRNHLRAVLDRRSPVLLWGWLVRNTKFVVGTALRGDRKIERLRLRARGVADGVAGRLGRRVEPR